MNNKFSKLRLTLLVALALVWAFGVVFTAEAAAPTPVAGTATVNGNIGEWNTSTAGPDFFAPMYRAGKNDANHPLESNSYARYDCDTQTLYIMVLSVNGRNIKAGSSDNEDSFVKINGSNKVNGEDNEPPNGTLPDFAWYDKSGNFASGWEAAFTLAPGSYKIWIHANVDNGGTQTSSTLGQNDGIDLTIAACPKGSITIIKQTLPDGDQTSFKFDPSWSSSDFFLKDGEQHVKSDLNAGTYSVQEENYPSGWFIDEDLSGCSDGSDYDDIKLSAGENVTCTIWNVKKGTIKIKKTATGGGSSKFYFDPSWSNSDFDLKDGETETKSNLTPGVYSVIEETIPSGWYLDSVSCDDESPIDAIQLDPGETVTCTFVNKKKGEIKIKKIAAGGGSTDFFFDLSWKDNNLKLEDGDDEEYDLPAGIYSVQEVSIPAGWGLFSATCSDGSPINAIDLSADEDITCTFINKKIGSIKVEKQAAVAGTFEFTGTFPTFNLNSNTSTTFSGLFAGPYSIVETLDPNWGLVSASCDDLGTQAVEQINPNNINLAAGQNLVCKFVNVRKTGNVILFKDVDPNDDPSTFDLYLDDELELDEADNGSSTQVLTVETGTHEVEEKDGNLGDLTHFDSTVVCYDITGNLQNILIALNSQNTDAAKALIKQSPSVGSGETSAEFDVDADHWVFCLFTNTLKTGDLSVFKFRDINKNGVPNIAGGESWLGGWEISVFAQGADPDTDAPLYTGTTAEVTGNVVFEDIPQGTYLVCEEERSHWTITVGTICREVTVGDGTTETTFANFENRTYTFRKVSTPATNAPVYFDWTLQNLNGGDPGDLTVISDGPATVVSGGPNLFTITELVPDGWDLDKVVCNGQEMTITDDGITFDTRPAETDVDCTFYNVRKPSSITIVKNVVSGDTTKVFDFKQHETDTDVSLMHGQSSDPIVIDPGVFNVIETVPEGWETPTATCVDQDGANTLGGTITSSTTFTAFGTIEAGQNITCTFNNTMKPTSSITIVKNVVSGDTTKVFDFKQHETDTDVSLMHGQSSDPIVIDPGVFNVIETVPEGWETPTATCVDQDGANTLGGTITSSTTFTAFGTIEAGQNITCTFNNTMKPTGSITIVKEADPEGNKDFKFRGSLGGNGFWLDDEGNPNDNDNVPQSKKFEDLAAGDYRFEELVPDGWTLDKIICEGADYETPVNDHDNIVIIHLDDDEDAVCTFYNVQDPGTITVIKEVVGVDGYEEDGLFDLLIDGQVYADGVGDEGTTGAVTLPAGNHTISELGHDTDLSLYDQTILCKDGHLPIGFDDDSDLTINLKAGHDVTCWIVNTRKAGWIEIFKHVKPHDATGVFDLLLDGNVVKEDAGDGDGTGLFTPIKVPAGLHTISETAGTNTNLEFFSSEYECYKLKKLIPLTLELISQGDGTSVDVNVHPGDVILCKFINTKDKAKLTIIKEVVYEADYDSDSDDDFSFYLNDNEVAVLDDPLVDDADGIDDNETLSIEPGSYELRETYDPKWEQTYECNVDGDDISPEIGLEFEIEAGDHVTCTFTNTRLTGTLTIEKVVKGDAADSEWEFNVEELDGLLQTDGPIAVSGTTPGAGGTTTTWTLPTDAYRPGEVLKPGYTLTKIDCGDAGQSTTPPQSNEFTVIVNSGEDVVCVFTNEEDGQIILHKSVSGGGPAGINDFGLTQDGVGVDSGEAVTYPAGTEVTLNEAGDPDYQFASIGGDEGCPNALGGNVTVVAGETLECTITNRYVPRCPALDPWAHLSAVILPTGNPNEWKAVITNISECKYDVGFASYEKTGPNQNDQILFSSDTRLQIPQGDTTITLTVPECAAQMDVFFDASHNIVYPAYAGQQANLDLVPLVLPGFNTGLFGPYGNIYGTTFRLLAFKHIGGNNFCEDGDNQPPDNDNNNPPPPVDDDKDNDGVKDDVDQCDDVPANTADGCPLPPPDDDKDDDGVKDDVDECDDVPADTANGCPLPPPPPPTDTDQDGVPDDLDECDDVAANTQNGCPLPPPPPPTCEPNPDADLRNGLTFIYDANKNALTIKGQVKNQSVVCSYDVGLASYSKANDNVDDQSLYDADTGEVGPGEEISFTISIPDCHTQVDLFYGGLLQNFQNGARYGKRLLAAKHVTFSGFCGQHEEEEEEEKPPQQQQQDPPVEETVNDLQSNEEPPVDEGNEPPADEGEEGEEGEEQPADEGEEGEEQPADEGEEGEEPPAETTEEAGE